MQSRKNSKTRSVFDNKNPKIQRPRPVPIVELSIEFARLLDLHWEGFAHPDLYLLYIQSAFRQNAEKSIIQSMAAGGAASADSCALFHVRFALFYLRN